MNDRIKIYARTHIQSWCPLNKNKLDNFVWISTIIRKRKLLALKWHSILEGGRKWWEVEVKLSADEDSTQEILQASSLFWISWGPRGTQSKEQQFSSLNFHSITLLWVVNQVPEKSQQGQARWEIDISSLNVSQCSFVTPVSSYQLSRLRLCPLWGFLISCWASNRHVNPECNCEVKKGEARVTQEKRRTEGKESIHKIHICSVTWSRSL